MKRIMMGMLIFCAMAAYAGQGFETKSMSDYSCKQMLKKFPLMSISGAQDYLIEVANSAIKASPPEKTKDTSVQFSIDLPQKVPPRVQALMID